MRRLILGLVILFTSATLASAQTPVEYFPLKKGSKWTYKLNDFEVVVEVGDYDKDKNETKLKTLSQGKEVANETITTDATGIYRSRINTTAIDPKVKILELKDGKPAAKGTKWTIKSKVQQQDISGDFEIKDDKMALKVPAGDLTDVVYVEGAKLTIAGTETAVKYWFAKGKGIVKLSYTINGQDVVLELKSYEEAK